MKKRFLLFLVFSFFVFLYSLPIYAQENALNTLESTGVYGGQDGINPNNSFNYYNENQDAKSMFLLGDTKLTQGLLESDGFMGIFNTILQIIITLAAIWAVIELSYYGAKYALFDSFTGKKDAIKNIWPVAYGLIALLAIYILFKQINPKILELGLNQSDINQNQGTSPELPVSVRAPETVRTSIPDSGGTGSATAVNLPFDPNSQDDAKKIYGNTKEAMEACNEKENKKDCRSLVKDIKLCSNLSYNPIGLEKQKALAACSRSDMNLDINKQFYDIYNILLGNNNEDDTVD